MLIKKKLKDITVEEYKKWENGCCTYECSECHLLKVKCNSGDSWCWVYNKDLYSDKFLNQELEIETDILTEKEKEYLSNVIKPLVMILWQ